ncbi:hypothetical protein BH10PSE7_BH10PSE7_19600 [soil metagenome]
MDWDRAIEINHIALSRIVAALIAMVELAGGGMPARLSRPVYRAVLLMLRPAEAAVRRLIVIAARGVVAKPYAVRPMPAGLAISRSGGARLSFQLFDPPMRFDFTRPRRTGPRPEPRIHFFGNSPFVPMFQPQPPAEPEPEPDETVSAARLGRRLLGVKLALDTLPRQAKRLVRWQARRAAMTGAKSRSPLRLGRPPGSREKPKDDIDWVLRECHALARDVLNENTS